MSFSKGSPAHQFLQSSVIEDQGEPVLGHLPPYFGDISSINTTETNVIKHLDPAKFDSLDQFIDHVASVQEEEAEVMRYIRDTVLSEFKYYAYLPQMKAEEEQRKFIKRLEEEGDKIKAAIAALPPEGDCKGLNINLNKANHDPFCVCGCNVYNGSSSEAVKKEMAVAPPTDSDSARELEPSNRYSVAPPNGLTPTDLAQTTTPYYILPDSEPPSKLETPNRTSATMLESLSSPSDLRVQFTESNRTSYKLLPDSARQSKRAPSNGSSDNRYEFTDLEPQSKPPSNRSSETHSEIPTTYTGLVPNSNRIEFPDI